MPHDSVELPPPAISQRARWAAGQPISELMHRALAQPELISLAAGFVDQDSLPVEATRDALDGLWDDAVRARAALQYGTTKGLPALRQAVIDQLREADGPSDALRHLSADQVIVTAGSNQMLHLLADTLFDPGDIVLCAAPTYFVFLGLLRNLGVRAVSVESDRDGLIPEALDERLRHLERAGDLPRVRAIYVVSYFDNPSTATLSQARRPVVVELARRWSKHHRLQILDDMAYRELRYSGSDVPSLRAFDPEGQTVITTHTLSKSFSPGLRVGWGILPRDLVEPVAEQKGNHDFGSANFNQHVLAEVFRRGLWAPHVAAIRDVYRTRLAALLAALDTHLRRFPGVSWERPEGGLYVWLRLPEGLDAGPGGPLFERALAEGVLYVPGQYAFAPEGVPAARHTIRLSFGASRPERIAAGITALGRAIDAAFADQGKGS